MSEKRSVHNEFSGDAHGPVVQAGEIGRIVFNPPPQGLPPEDLAIYQRLLAREAARANAEDMAAQAAQAEVASRTHRALRARRRRWWYLLLMLLWAGAAIAHVWFTRFLEAPRIEVMVLWLAGTVFLVFLGARNSLEAQTGRRPTWSDMLR
ncbi:hypothetical protein ACIQM4_05845 [Streptomyces sp. NPDC091272]|uniref:hypothetical protein n=1 Tax=Streptomyces sp. NPDC091272 TaxID=3365981 RepID=UPI0038264268